MCFKPIKEEKERIRSSRAQLTWKKREFPSSEMCDWCALAELSFVGGDKEELCF